MASQPSYLEIRARIAALTAERAKVQNAPATRTELVSRLNECIAFHGQGAPAFLNGVFDDRREEFMVGGTYHGDARTVRDLLCRYIPDVVRERETEAIDARLAGKTTISATDKKARLAEIDQRLHALQIDEERGISTAELNTNPIPRRADIDPKVFLEAHGPSVAREKLQAFEIHALQLRAAAQSIHETMYDARAEVGRTERNLVECRRTSGRTRNPTPAFRDLPAGVGEAQRPMLVTQDPTRERRLLQEFETARQRFKALQEQYSAAGARSSEFGTGYQRLREALAGRAARAA